MVSHLPVLLLELRGKRMSLNMSLDGIDTSGDWETYTSVSGKYKHVSVQAVMNRLMKL